MVFEYRPAASAGDYATISTDTTAVGMEYKAAWGDLSLSDGAYEFRVRVTDKAGNLTVVGPIDVIVDLKPPTVELKAPAPAAPGDVFFTESGAPLFAAEAKDDPATVGAVASGVDRIDFRYKLKGALPALPADWTAADFTLLSTSHEANALADWGSTVLADGHYVFAVQSFDLAGNAGALDTQEVVIDSAPPIVAITAPLAGAKVRGGAPYTITWTATDTYFGTDPIKIEYSPTNGDTWPTVLATATANDGSFTWNVPAADVSAAKIRVTATDAMSRQTVVVSGPFVIDNTPPAAPTGVTATDNDDVQPGIDGRDFTVSWTPSVSTGDGEATHLHPACRDGARCIRLRSGGGGDDSQQHHGHVDRHECVDRGQLGRTVQRRSRLPRIRGGGGSRRKPTGILGGGVARGCTGGADGGRRERPRCHVRRRRRPGLPCLVDGVHFPRRAHHRIYILPGATALNVSAPGAHTPVATVTDDSVPWVGSDSIQNDSAGAPLAAVAYKVYVVATDDDGRSAWNSAPMTPAAE